MRRAAEACRGFVELYQPLKPSSRRVVYGEVLWRRRGWRRGDEDHDVKGQICEAQQQKEVVDERRASSRVGDGDVLLLTRLKRVTRGWTTMMRLTVVRTSALSSRAALKLDDGLALRRGRSDDEVGAARWRLMVVV